MARVWLAPNRTCLIPILVLCFAPALRPELLQAQGGVPGTYEILVCRNRCAFDDTIAVAARGTLVLLAANFDTLAHARWRRLYSFMSHEGPPNACFDLRRREDADTYAGISGGRLTHWSWTGRDTVRVV